MLEKNSSRVERIKLVVNTNTTNTYKSLEMVHRPFSVHLRFPLGTVKPCLVSERVTRADPQTVSFDKILNIWGNNSHPNFLHFVQEDLTTVYTFRVS